MKNDIIHTFNSLIFKKHPVVGWGGMSQLVFKNGYGVSVVFGAPILHGNGSLDDTYEVAFLKNGEYFWMPKEISTDNDLGVLPYQSSKEVTEIMLKIQSLEPNSL